MSEDVEKATKTFQFALSTRAGCECVSHVLQTLLEMDENTTLLSVDGVGAFDLISRKAMMEGLLDMRNGDKLLLFVRLFCGSPSTFLWENEMGTVRRGRRTRRRVNARPLFLDNIEVCVRSRRGWVFVNTWLLSWMTCTSQRAVQQQLWTERKCGGTPRSHFTLGRQ